jgi:AraC-like DNA-binding protein
MTYDKDGYLWLSSDRGIQRLSIIQLHQVADRNNMKVGGVRIGVSDGLLSDRCIDFEKNGILIPKKDTIWFATNRGIAEVKTQQLNINNTPPGVLINEVRINSKKVPFSREVRVFHDSQHISFSFSINTFISQENAHIKYRLYGYEDTWKELQRSDQRQVTYFNLPDGSYEFKVIASNSHGVWNRSGDKREFIIKTSFVKKKVFIILLFAIIFGLIIISILFLKKYKYYKKINNRYKNSIMDEEESQIILKKIESQLEVQKIYRDDNLSLQILAEKIETNSHRLSRVINEKKSLTFRELINSYRINEAKILLLKDGTSKLSVIDIALMVGFNSNVSFNRAFKKYSGCTPSEYRKIENDKIIQ